MVIAGPNLTIDRTLSIDELRPGEVLRFERAVVSPGGKGVNVARVARELGAGAVLVGFVPGRTGAAAARRCWPTRGSSVRGVEVGGELRSTAVVLERSGRVTVFNEPGPPLAPGDWERYEAAVAEALAGERVLACSGSLPPGAPDDAYARLVALAQGLGALAVVDVGGEQLAAALAAGADVVTPNLAEAEGLLHGRADETVEAGDPVVVRERALAAARALVERGARRAVVTAAAAGAAVADGAEAWWLRGAVGGGGAQPDRRGGCAGRWSGAGAGARRAVRRRGGRGDGVRGGERGDGCRGRGGARAGGGVARAGLTAVAFAALRRAYSITEGKRTRGCATVRGRPPRERATRSADACDKCCPGHQSSTLPLGRPGRAPRGPPSPR